MQTLTYQEAVNLVKQYPNDWYKRLNQPIKQDNLVIARNTRIVNTFSNPVSKIKGNDGNYHIVDQNNNVLSTVSERYTLVQNSDIITPLVNRFGIESLKSMYSFQSGKNLYMTFESGRQFDIGGGDIIKERFVAINSYDKSRSFQFMIGAFRLVCTNGLFSQFAGISYKKIHVGVIPLNSIISSAFKALESNNYDNWRKLKTVSLTVPQEIELIQGFNAVEVKDTNDTYSSGNVLNRQVKHYTSLLVNKPENLDNQRNAWGLYNQFNRAVASYFGSHSQTVQKININLKAEEYLLKQLNLN